MKIEINPESVAMLLAQKKVEKKYESLGFSPYESTYEEMIGLRYTEDAEKDYDKHYKYFLEILLSKELITHSI
tara:strand:- start:190 stop:408 length:219 start_codon:yes stop_codon:yes gene_type:complete